MSNKIAPLGQRPGGRAAQTVERGQPARCESNPLRPACQAQAPSRQGGIPLRLPDGRVVAWLAGDVLVAHRRGSLHRLRRPPAWCVDVGVLQQAERAGARMVFVEDIEEGGRFWAALTTIYRRGLLVDRGHGRQLALPLKHWRPTRSEAERLAGQLVAEQMVLPGFELEVTV